MTAALHRNMKVDFVAKVGTAWNGKQPPWVEELARFATENSQTKAAKLIGYSQAVVSHVFANTYQGDMSRVEAKVRGALMHETVGCPVLGDIGRDRCLDEQGKKFAATSSLRVKLFHACRSGCPHSRLKTT
jgi:hypothetical protein